MDSAFQTPQKKLMNAAEPKTLSKRKRSDEFDEELNLSKTVKKVRFLDDATDP